MTVCIAAICQWMVPNNFWIVGASDRMLSAPDIKFEPPQQKIYRFHQNAVALIAGDPYAQVAICSETMRVIGLRPAQTIKHLADVYADAYSAHRRQAAEAKYLKPLGLDANSFVDRSQDIKGELLSDLQLSMQREAIEAEAIIAGVDATGPHLFVITDPGVVTCADSVAFASIGSGKNHADSYFMMAHHTRFTPFHKVLLDTYLAKRRSEVSPTVGTATDLFYIGPTGFQTVEPVVYDALERIRGKLDREIEISNMEAENEAWNFVDEYTRPKPPQQPAPPPTATDPAPNTPSPFDALLTKEEGSSEKKRKGSPKRRKK